jgi:phosphoribosyl-ATP pyrophosphohydrolase
MSFNDLELKVIRWGEARGIVKNGKPMGQAIKTLEEVTELIDALHRDDQAEVEDAIGDILVTLIMVCETRGVGMVQCLAGAYDQIKDRTGYLRPDGVFVKDAA